MAAMRVMLENDDTNLEDTESVDRHRRVLRGEENERPVIAPTGKRQQAQAQAAPR